MTRYGARVSASLPPRRSPGPLQGRREVIPSPAASRVGRVLSPQHRAMESMMRSQAHRRNAFPTSARNRAAAGPRALQSAIQGLLGGLRPSGLPSRPITQTPGPPSRVMGPGGLTQQPLVYQPNPMGAPTPMASPPPPPAIHMLPYYAAPTGIAAPYQVQGQLGLASSGPVRGMTVY